MEMISDILLVAGAVGVGAYCFVLARRLNRFNDLETGMGGAVAVLSAQVDDLTRTLQAARQTADDSARSLASVTERAEDVARRLELLVAAMHDLPNQEVQAEPHRTAVATSPVADSGPVFKRHHDLVRGAAQ
ncbi:MAG: DUF6468 domain-containing protein [Roseovarius sp.]